MISQELIPGVTVPDLIGLAGVAVSVYSYARLQLRREYAKELSYSMWNVVCAVLFETSLFFHFNLSSFVGNLVWLLISLFGVYRCMKYRIRDRRALRQAVNDQPASKTMIIAGQADAA